MGRQREGREGRKGTGGKGRRSGLPLHIIAGYATATVQYYVKKCTVYTHIAPVGA